MNSRTTAFLPCHSACDRVIPAVSCSEKASQTAAGVVLMFFAGSAAAPGQLSIASTAVAAARINRINETPRFLSDAYSIIHAGRRDGYFALPYLLHGGPQYDIAKIRAGVVALQIDRPGTQWIGPQGAARATENRL